MLLIQLVCKLIRFVADSFKALALAEFVKIYIFYRFYNVL